MEHAAVEYNMTEASSGASYFHLRLGPHASYKDRWKSRVAMHFNSSTGVFGIAANGDYNSATLFENEANTFDLTIHCEWARWGDGATTPAFTRTHWIANKDYIRTSWLVQRRAAFLSQLQARGLAD